MININKKLLLFALFSVLFLAGSLVPVPDAQAASIHHVYAGENIEDEIALMDPGDLLIVHKGTYDTTVAGGSHVFPIIVDVSITIIAVDGPVMTIIDAEDTSAVIVVEADKVTIKKFTITNGANTVPWIGHGIFLDDVQGCVISRNVIVNNEDDGIELELSNNNHIKYNRISWNGDDGIFLDESDNNKLIGNKIVSNDEDGIQLEDCDNNLIIYNRITNQKEEQGIDMDFCDNNKIIMNTIRSNEGAGIAIDDSDGNLVKYNGITNNGGDGIDMEVSNENYILGNTVLRNGSNEHDNGIEVTDSVNNTIKYNRVFDNSKNDLSTEDPADNTWINNRYGVRNW